MNNQRLDMPAIRFLVWTPWGKGGERKAKPSQLEAQSDRLGLADEGQRRAR
jgi:hypothetical protein